MKQKIFFISLFLIPFFLLLITEGFFRLIDYGESYSIVIEKELKYCINQNFPKKYFSKRDIAIPEMIEQTFNKVKQNNTLRIICLGGSTTAGFPYEININFPYFVKDRLQWLLPDKQIEVVNLGVTAINSHAVLDMMPEVIKLEPDIVLIYMGHNEFYGALGMASSEYFGGNRLIIRLILTLRNFRLYQFLQNSIDYLSSILIKSTTPDDHSTLMKAMIGKDQVQYNSPLFIQTLDNFKYNLKEILNYLNSHHIPVIVSDLVCNLKDQPPLGINLIFSKNVGIMQQFKKAQGYENQHNWQEAIKLYRPLLERDSLIAEVNYHLACCYYKTDDIKRAKEYYIRARDYDTTPFRAQSQINDIIHQICRKKQAVFISADTLFTANSPNGITDNSLFLEHLHPNEKGYFLLGQLFVDAIKELKKDIQPLKEEKTSQEYFQQSGFTLLDQAIGELKIQNLVRNFPFKGHTNFKTTEISYRPVLQIARKHVYDHLFWDAAHFQLGDQYLKDKKFQHAFKEYQAVLKYLPDHTTALYKLGNVMYAQQKWQKAISFYLQALQNKPEASFLHAKLGKAYIISQQDTKGINELNTVLKLESKKPQLKVDELKTIYYLLAIGHARKKQFSAALNYLNSSLKIDSSYHPALELKYQIQHRAKK